MNKNIFFLCAAVLLFFSCKPDGSSGDSSYSNSYLSIEYKNDSVSWDISFKNAANESYTLKKGESITVGSDKRGRGNIIELKPAYVTWKQNNDMYHIEFIDREEKYELKIENYTGRDVILTENSGYLEPDQIKISAASPQSVYRFDADAGNFLLFTGTVYIYTKEPVLQVDGSWKIKKSGRSEDKTFIYGIFDGNAPADWE